MKTTAPLFGFHDGTFVVVDHTRRIGVFAFATSPHETAARRNPGKVAKEMVDSFWNKCPDNLREEHYAMSCRDLGIDPAPANQDDTKQEVLQQAVSHPDNLPAVVECSNGLDPLFGDRFDVLGLIPACRAYTSAGNLWTCDTYYLRDQFDGGCYVAPVSHFAPA